MALGLRRVHYFGKKTAPEFKDSEAFGTDTNYEVQGTCFTATSLKTTLLLSVFIVPVGLTLKGTTMDS
jgi:hypothetical protein